ncbi:MAG: hypothetical protein D4R81_04995 [Nitrospiraceae bacterium]|nr:MAG: hypothetical protein D4R81_04995 [Nitrospiraceae bacterium]
MKTSPEVLQRTPEQEKALRSEFMADLKWLDDIAARKEGLIQSYMDISDLIEKLKSKAVASRNDEVSEVIRKGLDLSAAAKLDRLIEYQLLVQREELEKSFQGKLIAKSDYLKELHALEEKKARDRQLSEWRRMSDEICRSLKGIEHEISNLKIHLGPR